MTGGGWSTLAAEARRIADAALPLVEPPAPVCPCGRQLEDGGGHLVAAAVRELRRARLAGRSAT